MGDETKQVRPFYITTWVVEASSKKCMHACIRNFFAIRIVLRLTPFRKPGSFCGLRLLPGKALEGAIPELVKRLAKDLVDNPPYEMSWLLGLVKNQGLVDSPTRCLLGLEKKQKVENEVRGQ